MERREGMRYNSDGPNGERIVSAARVALLELAGRLTEDEAAAVLTVARAVAGSGSKARTRVRALEDRSDVRAIQAALAEPERTPYEEYRRKRGL